MHIQGVSAFRFRTPEHSVKCDTHVADHGLLLITHTALGPLTQRLWPQLHRFDLSLYLLQCWLHNKHNDSIRWSLSIIVQICGNNGLDSNLLSTDACCLVIIFCWPCSMVDFLLCDAMLSAVYAVVACLSGCLPVCVCVSVCDTPVLYQNG